MIVRILSIHYSRPNNKGKYRLFRIDYGVKYTNPKTNRLDKYVMVQASHKSHISTDFNTLKDQFDYIKVRVNNGDYGKIHHTRFVFFPDTQYYVVKLYERKEPEETNNKNNQIHLTEFINQET